MDGKSPDNAALALFGKPSILYIHPPEHILFGSFDENDIRRIYSPVSFADTITKLYETYTSTNFASVALTKDL